MKINFLKVLRNFKIDLKIKELNIYFSNLKNTKKFLIILLLVTLFPTKTLSAEILQINSSNNILVGDQNRNLTIKLFCVSVKDDDEQYAISLLKKEFPRGSKVKIKPFGFSENTLTAKVTNIKGTKDMSDLLISQNLTNEDCLN